MPRLLRLTALALRDLLVAAGPIALLAAGLIWGAYRYLAPMPPRVVTLATGQEQGAYAEFGRRYAAWLAQHGIEVRLRTTQGSVENLALLRDPSAGVDVAFVRGGTDAVQPALDSPRDDTLQAIGGLFQEPLWLFYREDAAWRHGGRSRLEALRDLSGWRLNIGTEGSGVPKLMERILEANRLDPGALTLTRLGDTDAVVELLERRLDALVFVSAPEAPMIQMLLLTPGIRLFDFAQAQAYARRYPFLGPVTLPRGVVDLARDLPPRDARLVAPTAMLVAREDTHPALVQLFAQAARAIHGEAGWFQARGEFPSERGLEWPLASEAERVMRGGTPLLQRWLPFWLANLVQRMWLVLLSIVAVMIPLAKVVPPLYEFRVRSRIFRWYAELRRIEEELADAGGREALARRLDDLDDRVERITVPLSYADELYGLRTHIRLVRDKLTRQETPR